MSSACQAADAGSPPCLCVGHRPRSAATKKRRKDHGSGGRALPRVPSGRPPPRAARKARDASHTATPRAIIPSTGRAAKRGKAQGRPDQRCRSPQDSPATSRGSEKGAGGRLSVSPVTGRADPAWPPSFFSPSPDTRVRSSMDFGGPFSSRSATIFSAVAAPTPSSVSEFLGRGRVDVDHSVASEEDAPPPGPALRWIPPAPPSGEGAWIVAAKGDDDLLAVLQLLGQVHRIGPRLFGGAAYCRYRIDHPTACLQVVDAGRCHAPSHVNAQPRRPIAARHHVLDALARRGLLRAILFTFGLFPAVIFRRLRPPKPHPAPSPRTHPQAGGAEAYTASATMSASANELRQRIPAGARDPDTESSPRETPPDLERP